MIIIYYDMCHVTILYSVMQQFDVIIRPVYCFVYYTEVYIVNMRVHGNGSSYNIIIHLVCGNFKCK